MRDAGCFGVKLGFASGNQRVVDNIVNVWTWSRLSTSYTSWNARDYVRGTFTYGLPGERESRCRIPNGSLRRSLIVFRVRTAEIEGTPLATLVRVARLKVMTARRWRTTIKSMRMARKWRAFGELQSVQGSLINERASKSLLYIPCYNGEYIASCIEGWSRSGPDEIFVIDDGSTDQQLKLQRITRKRRLSA